jgi:hypothetical protein
MAVEHEKGARMKLRGDRCRCVSCNAYFNSTAAFDKHRSGAYGKDRRCLTPQEMAERGMEQNNDGYWITRRNPGFVREAA